MYLVSTFMREVYWGTRQFLAIFEKLPHLKVTNDLHRKSAVKSLDCSLFNQSHKFAPAFIKILRPTATLNSNLKLNGNIECSNL